MSKFLCFSTNFSEIHAGLCYNKTVYWNRYFWKEVVSLQMEKRYLRKIARIFGELSVPLRLYAKDGSCLLPEGDGPAIQPGDILPGTSARVDGLLIRCADVRPQAYIALEETIPGAADLLVMAEGILSSILGGEMAISSQSDVYRMALRQELTGDELKQRAQEHQIPLEMERCVMLFSLPESTAQNRAAALLSELLPLNDSDVLVDMNRTTAALLRDMHGVDGLDELKQYAQAVQETLLEEAMQQAVIAIGEPKHTLVQLGESYQEARRAMEVGLRFEPEETVFLYSRLILDRFLDALPREDCQYYYSLLFNRRTAKLLNEEMLQTIEMFFRKDLNLSDTARQLFIHRNTLVYRLDKVQRLTGLDLRRFDDAMTFRILYKLKRCLQDKPSRQP